MDIASAIIKEYLSQYPDGEVREHERMAEHVSFRIGGAARVMFFPKSAEELGCAMRLVRDCGMRMLVMGNGTNLLVSDAPLDMAVIKTHDGIGGISMPEAGVIEAGGGVLLSRIATFAQSKALAGFEFAHGIPGTLGGGLAMNAGAYGGELKDVLESVTVVDGGGEIKEIPASECDMAYRHSRFSDSGETVVSARIRLSGGDAAAIRARMDELSEKRRASQPLNMPSAGSTFKRPASGYAAAMIDAAGLKGYSVGGAQVSEKHAGFVINREGASFDDVMRLMEHIRETVYKNTGVMLEPEVKIIS